MRPATRNLLTLGCALLLVGAGPAVGSGGAPTESALQRQTPPRLVVLLIMDQLRADLLERYDSALSGGLRRLLDDGRNFVNTTHDHAQTETSPGHASISTGVYPSRHGVVRNAWWQVGESGQWEQVINVVDAKSPMIGFPNVPGASPGVLQRSGIMDWLVEAHPDARVASLSAKDRAAVLMAGQGRHPVYWIEPSAGQFMTSVYYRDQDLDWVRDFNRDWMAEEVETDEWLPRIPEALRGLSRADTVAYEHDRIHTHFPHRFLTDEERRSVEAFEKERSQGAEVDPSTVQWGEAGEDARVTHWWDGYSPGPDAAVLALARRAVEAQDMGQDDVPDLLALSLSQMDRIGHNFGPFSREEFEILMAADREIGAFLQFLDETVGEGQYVVAFTSDHGAQAMPEYRVEQGQPGQRLTRAELRVLEVGLNELIQAQAQGATRPIAEGLLELTAAQEWTAMAWSRTNLIAGETPDSFAVLQANSLHPLRPAGLLSRFGVEYQYPEGTLDWAWAEGTHHGSIYYYDRHVPLMFMGPGIEAGPVADRIATVDIAPTLARILGIPFPDDLDGSPIF